MNKDYRFEVYTELSDFGDKVFVVKYFDFYNVIGVGDTLEEAIEEAKGNLDVYLEYCLENNIPIPDPSDKSDLDYSGKVTLRMSKKLHRQVDEMAKREGVSLNSFLNEAIISYVTEGIVSNRLLDSTRDGILRFAEESNIVTLSDKMNKKKA